MTQPNGSYPDLEWQRLGAAIASGNLAAAREHLEAIVSTRPTERELVERGLFSRTVQPTADSVVIAAGRAA